MEFRDAWSIQFNSRKMDANYMFTLIMWWTSAIFVPYTFQAFLSIFIFKKNFIFVSSWNQYWVPCSLKFLWFLKWLIGFIILPVVSPRNITDCFLFDVVHLCWKQHWCTVSIKGYTSPSIESGLSSCWVTIWSGLTMCCTGQSGWCSGPLSHLTSHHCIVGWVNNFSGSQPNLWVTCILQFPSNSKLTESVSVMNKWTFESH